MITTEEYDRVQEILGNKGKPRSKSIVFPFTGMIRCGECGAMVTAENKTKVQKNGNVHYYTYYHCTKRKNPRCSQRSISEAKMEEQITEALKLIHIPNEILSVLMRLVDGINKKEIEDQSTNLESLQAKYNKVLSKMDKLIDMNLDGRLSDEDFQSKRLAFEKERKELTRMIENLKTNAIQWKSRCESLFNFANKAIEAFKKGTLEDKRQILSAIGSNLILKDQKLEISLEKMHLLAKEVKEEIRVKLDEKSRFEPVEVLVNKGLNSSLDDVFSNLYPREDSNLRPAV
jgi:predicted metal-binding protein